MGKNGVWKSLAFAKVSTNFLRGHKEKFETVHNIKSFETMAKQII